jgi:hypothetical protein
LSHNLLTWCAESEVEQGLERPGGGGTFSYYENLLVRGWAQPGESLCSVLRTELAKGGGVHSMDAVHPRREKSFCISLLH